MSIEPLSSTFPESKASEKCNKLFVSYKGPELCKHVVPPMIIGMACKYDQVILPVYHFNRAASTAFPRVTIYKGTTWSQP